MNKFKLAAVLATATMFGYGQENWSTSLNNFDEGQEALIGTNGNTPMIFVTSGSPKMSLSVDGVLTLNRLAGNENDRQLVVDHDGNLKTMNWSPVTYNCQSQVPWYTGGNKNNGIFNDIGTCDNNDFVLKANDIKLMFIKSVTGGGPYAVGIGPDNNAPSAMLDVSNGSSNIFGGFNHTMIHGDANGTIETYAAPMTLLSSDGLFYKSTMTNPPTEFFSINNSGHVKMGNTQVTGKLGINTTGQPLATLEIRDLATPEILVFNSQGSPNVGSAKVKVANALLSYEFMVDAAGTGHITNGAMDFLSYKPGGFPQYPQVWIGNRKPTGVHSDFQFGVDGKLIARSIYVIPDNSPGNTLWADYVFAADYKLPKLEEVEAFYKKNKHLPEIPNASEVEENGINLTEMNVLLLKKVEELTLYVVEQQKVSVQQQKEIEKLKTLVK